ncbi:MAG TPA: hypothetical protein VGC31_00685 [Paenirhodobacter sp.]
MTALRQYERLEALGLWREGVTAQRREVIVSFGDATLVIFDSRAERPLAHWSLAALVRRNPGKRPALFAPSEEPGEDLEIEDEAMIAAIEKVQAALDAGQPHPGRLRGLLLAVGATGVLIVAAIWLPSAVVEQAARIAPAATRADIGRAILADMVRQTGSPCHSTGGDEALVALADRLPGSAQIIIVPRGGKTGIVLPGNIVVLGREAITGQDTPEVLAGRVITTELAERGRNPLRPFLEWAGFGASLRLLAGAQLAPDTVKGYGKTLMQMPAEPADPADLLQAFASAGVASSPYAYARDKTGESVLPLIEGDPFRGQTARRPLLDEARWIALQDICN